MAAGPIYYPSPSSALTSARSSPWERYRSTKHHSFPDYGTSARKMVGGRQLLKTLNGSSAAGPVNTLNESHPAKRQRTSGPDAASPHARDLNQNLARSSSHDDPFDLRSTSSTNTMPGNRPQNVAEFRNTQPKWNGRNARKRKSRTPACTTRKQDPHLESPDALSGHDIPPAANIVSDIMHHSPPKRRSQRSGLVLPIKNHKPQSPAENICDDSEDELIHEPNNNGKKPTNFSAIRQPQRHARSRGDIQPSSFSSPRLIQAMSPLDQPPMIVKSAACGKESLESDGQHRKEITLRIDPSNSFELVPITANGERLPMKWLHINANNCHRMQCAPGESPYVVIYRSRVGVVDSKLTLEFTTIQGASALASCMSSVRCEHKQPCELGVIVRRTISDASQYRQTPYQLPIYPKQLQVAESSEVPWATAQSSQAANENTGLGRERMVDKMRDSARLSDTQSAIPTTAEGDVPSASNPIQSRGTRRSSPALVVRPRSPERWTSQNPGWKNNWHRSLVFPAAGKNRATVDDDDILRLDEGEFLNDNLISFYLRYLQDRLERDQPELLKRVYIFSTFFFEKLRSTKGKINYEGVRAWTAKFDLFSHDYVIVPVNEHAHWYLAIICNVPNALGGIPAQADVEMMDVSRDSPVPAAPVSSSNHSAVPTQPTSSNTVRRAPSSGGSQKLDPRQPKIVTLDSLGSQHPPTCKALKDYLVEEARDKKGVDLMVIPNGMKAREIPQQDNFCDCGVFVLGYVEEFLKDPDGVAQKLLQKDSLGWDMQPSLLRDNIRTLLFALQGDQQLRLEKEKEDKRKSAVKKKAAKQEKPRSPQSTVTVLPVVPGGGPANRVEAPTADKVACAEMRPSEEVKSESSAETFFSAQSSPDEKPPVKVATVEDREREAPDDDKSEPKFVTQLPTSPDSGRLDAGPCLERTTEVDPGRSKYFYDGIDPAAG